MFAQLLAALLGSVTQVAAEVDSAIEEFRKDPNNTTKAATVAKGVLQVVDTVAPIVGALTARK